MERWQGHLFQAVPKEEREGLRLQGPCWALSKDVKDPSRFFGAMERLAPEDAFLFFEGGDHPPELRAFLERMGVACEARPALGTIWPRQRLFTIPATPDVLQQLSDLARGLSAMEVCGHVHLFTTTGVLAEGYDAFTWTFFLSQSLPEEKVSDFCKELRCTYAVSTPRT